MKSVLFGNGINIEFGDKAYTNDYIMKRIKFRARLDEYSILFNSKVTGKEIIFILDGLVDEANKIRNGECDYLYANDEELELDIEDFKGRCLVEVNELHEIMLEDWFFLLHIFFLENKDLGELRNTVKQGFDEMILDGIYNGGKIQEIYNYIPKKVKQFINSFDNIFTLNYDNNIECLTKREVYHLHGDFSILAESENVEYASGYIRNQEGATVAISGMEHCFCNALLNYSGKEKYKVAKKNHDAIIYMDMELAKIKADESYKIAFFAELEKIKESKPMEYKMINAKTTHPELKMATEYYFDYLESIEGELSIIGMSPNNDGHIFNCILNNKKINKVYFYYFSESQKQYIEGNYDTSLFQCKSVTELWEKKGIIHKKYNCKVVVPDEIDKFIDCFNAMSGDTASKKQIIDEVKGIPEFERTRLCTLVKEHMEKHEGHSTPRDMQDLTNKFHSISCIALQEGILPSTLFMICAMNWQQ